MDKPGSVQRQAVAEAEQRGVTEEWMLDMHRSLAPIVHAFEEAPDCDNYIEDPDASVCRTLLREKQIEDIHVAEVGSYREESDLEAAGHDDILEAALLVDPPIDSECAEGVCYAIDIDVTAAKDYLTKDDGVIFSW